MTINKRLFHLGNNVVSLDRKIEKEFPDGNVFREIFIELLDVINEVRLAIQDEEPKQWHVFKVQCNSQEILAIKGAIEVLELNYELLKSGSEAECHTSIANRG